MRLRHTIETRKPVGTVVYFQSESRKLKRFEKNLSHAAGILTISKNDELHFSQINSNIWEIPVDFKNAFKTARNKPF